MNGGGWDGVVEKEEVKGSEVEEEEEEGEVEGEGGSERFTSKSKRETNL